MVNTTCRKRHLQRCCCCCSYFQQYWKDRWSRKHSESDKGTVPIFFVLVSQVSQRFWFRKNDCTGFLSFGSNDRGEEEETVIWDWDKYVRFCFVLSSKSQIFCCEKRDIYIYIGIYTLLLIKSGFFRFTWTNKLFSEETRINQNFILFEAEFIEMSYFNTRFEVIVLKRTVSSIQQFLFLNQSDATLHLYAFMMSCVYYIEPDESLLNSSSNFEKSYKYLSILFKY